MGAQNFLRVHLLMINVGYLWCTSFRRMKWYRERRNQRPVEDKWCISTRGPYVVLMHDVFHTFSEPNQLVLEAIAGIVSTKKAFLLLDKPMQFIGCYKDDSWLENMMSGSVLDYACQLLRLQLELQGGGHRKKLARMNLVAKRQRLREPLDSCGLPCGKQLPQTLQEHMVSYLCTLLHNYSGLIFPSTC